MHWIADKLVRETTRVAARNLALSVIVNRHLSAFAESSAEESDTDSDSVNQAEKVAAQATDVSQDQQKPHKETLLQAMQSQLNLHSDDYVLLKLDDGLGWQNLGGVTAANKIDLEKLYKLEGDLKDWQKDREEAVTDATPEDDSSVALSDRLSFTLSGPSAMQVPFQEYGPVQGFYFYYHPVQFTDRCMVCHSLTSRPTTLTSNADTAAFTSQPFRSVRIRVPYETTRVWTIWAYSSMVAVAVATLSIALFLEHRILKRLVIRPLHHLRDITDRVASGETAIRSNLETKDEFQTLSDSLNHMLRNLMDTQLSLEGANRKLDEQVDEMARVNLELFEANRLKSEFLANMSHELRTPLNSILGFSDVLHSVDALNEKQKRYAANIQKSGRLLLEMINDILDLAKIEAGKMQIRCSEFDLIDIVDGQCELIRSLSDEKNIDVKVTVERNEGDDALVFQDKGKLQQILNNLLSNAIKFTPEGGFVNVEVDMTQEDLFSIAVVDTGVGIAESDRETIFEKFRQVRSKDVSDSLTREASGTGLGLSITKELCRLLGGEISVESEVGKGSTFTFVLPLRYKATGS